MQKYLLIIILFLTKQSISQLVYKNSFNESLSPNGLIITTDSGTIIYSVTLIKNDLSGYVAKVDRNGNYQWSKYYRIKGYNMRITSIAAASNGGFLAVAKIDSSGKLPAFVVIRCNKEGEIIWDKKVLHQASSNNFTAIDITAAKDGGFYLYYMIPGADYYEPRTHVVNKYNKDGLLVWSSAVKFSENDYGSFFSGFKEIPDESIVAMFGVVGCEAYCSYKYLYAFKKDGTPGATYRIADENYGGSRPIISGDKNGDNYLLYSSSIDNRNTYYTYSHFKPSLNRVEVYTMDNNLYTVQKFLSRNNLRMMQGQSFYNGVTSFSDDWGLIKTYSYYDSNNVRKLMIEKSDNVGRVCPAYEIPESLYHIKMKEMQINPFRFSLADTSAVTLTDINIITATAGTMTVVCDGIATQSISSVNSDAPLANTDQGIHLAPNPAINNCILYFRGSQTGSLQIRITDVSGRIIIVKTTSIQKGENKIPIDIVALKSGLHFIQVETGGIRKTLKLIKQ